MNINNLLQEEIYEIFQNNNIIQRGHFKLSSGLHSDTYFQLSRLFENPKLNKIIVRNFINKNSIFDKPIDLVIGIAMGSVLFSYELSNQLGIKNIFCERQNGLLTFRRNFKIKENTNVYIVEDVLTTGKSLLEAINLVKQSNCKIVGVGTLVLRNNSLVDELKNIDILIPIKAEAYEETICPMCKQNIPIITPGSRFLKC